MDTYNKKKLGIYVHIPFCKKRCNYCSFASNVGISKAEQWQYISSLLKEWIHYENLGSSAGWQYETLYLGGGTPTVLDRDNLERLLEGLFKNLNKEDLHEFTIEANPGTITEEKLRLLRAYGCNRLSMGVQSFDPAYLSWLGRSHTVEDIYESWALARKFGWENLSLDLMYGLQDQENFHWQKTIEKALALEPEHISLYQLNVEPNTILEKMVNQGEANIVDEETARQQYLITREILLSKGFAHYEISNYAKPGMESRHNLIYWRNQEYIGLGASASGYLNRIRYTNMLDINSYSRSLWRSLEPRAFEEVITDEMFMEEEIILNFRTAQGLDKAAFMQRFGQNIEAIYGETIKKYLELGMMKNDQDHLYLTAEGFLQSNQILMDFIKIKK